MTVKGNFICEGCGCVVLPDAILLRQGKKIVGGGIKIGLKPKELKEAVDSAPEVSAYPGRIPTQENLSHGRKTAP